MRSAAVLGRVPHPYLLVLCLSLASSLLVFSSMATGSYAQVTSPITSSGLNTSITKSGQVFDITGGTRPGNGANLFHSFGEFGVPTNNIANFLNETALPTSNILGRVTGGNPSNIFGTIQTTGFGGANLFLMNPAGIVFGPNASLNVGGSVSFTTADYLRLADGAQFRAIPGPQDTSISSAPVAAYGFLGSNPGAITVQGSQLSVPAGADLALIGGNITIQSSTLENATTQPAQLSAPGGKISLASVASSGEILAGSLEQTSNLNGQSFGSLGAIQITEKSVIDVSGNGGGTVAIRGGRFVLDDSFISANVTGPDSGSPGAGIDIVMSQDVVIQNGAILNVTGDAPLPIQHGGVYVEADRIEIFGSEDMTDFPLTGITTGVAPGSAVHGGDITLKANSIQVKDFGTATTVVETTTLGDGNAGKVSLSARDNLEIDGGTIDSFAVLGAGHAGDIELGSTQGNILMTNHTFVSSQASPFSTGNSGAILLDAPKGNISLADMTQISNAARGDGTLGGIEINANNLTLLNSGIAGDNLTTQPAGNITASITGNLMVGGMGFRSFITTLSRGPAPAADMKVVAKNVVITDGAFLSTETFSSGPGGHLNIVTDDLQLTNGGQIRSGSTIAPALGFPGEPPPETPSGVGGTISIQGFASPATSVILDGADSGIATNAQGTGAGGTINLAGQSLTLQNGGTISASTSGTESSATGGDISVLAGQSVTLNNGGSFTASSSGPANAGNIAINAGAQFLSQNASVTTEAKQASGGNITVQATDSIRLINSQLSTSVQGGPNTSGGNITLDPAVVTLQNSQVLAQAVQGTGGNINIIAGTFLADQTSIVSASSQFGLSGVVNIQSPLSNLSGTLATLPQRPLQVQHLLQQRCAAQANGQLSSLVVAGRDTLPSEPGGWLMSSMALLSNDVPVSQPNPLTRNDLVPSDQKMIVSGQLYEQRMPSSQQSLTSWTAGCGS